MSDSKDIISLNCPNCQAPLSCKSTEMTVTCEHCGTSVLIKDFVTKSRINKNDKLESNLAMAENALKTKDWKSAYKYYESICKTTKSDEDLAIFNALGYICGKIEFRIEYVENCSNINIDKRKIILDALKDHIESLRAGEIRTATNKYGDIKTRKKVYQSINSKYLHILDKLDYEIKMIAPLKCVCGNVIEYNEDSCSNCGKTRSQVLSEIRQNELNNRKLNKLSIIALIACMASILFGSCTVAYIRYSKASSAVLFGLVAIISFVLFIIISNFKIRDYIIDNLCKQVSYFDKIKETIKKVYLPVMAIVPALIIIVLGANMNVNSDDAQNVSADKEAVTTMISTANETTASTTIVTTVTTVTEKETEKPTEKPTERPTEPQTEAPIEEAVEVEEENYYEEPVIEEDNNEADYEETPQENIQNDYQEEENNEYQFIVYYTKTGSKYHYENPCGRGTYYECTLDEALAMGLEPCDKCVN